MNQTTRSAPTVFISAATIDLKRWRDVIAQAFRAAQFRVLVQDDSLGVSTGNVRDLLVDAINQSDCVIHLAGLGYGTHAQAPFPEAPHFQCSWTQFEYYYAHAINKRVIALVCSASISKFQNEEEGNNADRLSKAELQKAHCARVLSGEFKGTPWEGKFERALNEPSVDHVDKLLTTVAAAVGKLQRQHPDYGVAETALHEELKRLANEHVDKLESVDKNIVSTGRSLGRRFGIGAILIVLLMAGGILWLDWKNREVVDAINGSNDPAVLGERFRRAIHAEAEDRIKALPDGIGRALEIAKIENERDHALSRVNELITLMQKGLKGSTSDTFKRATEILQKDGTDAALQYLKSRRQSTLDQAKRHADLAEKNQGHGDEEKQHRNEYLMSMLLESDLLETQFQWQESLQILELAEQIAPDWFEVCSRLGRLHLTMGHFCDAEKHLQAALMLSPSDTLATALNNYSVALYKNRRSSDKESMLQLAIVLEQNGGDDQSGFGRLLINLGETLRSEGKFQEAEPLIRRAVELDEIHFGTIHPNTAYNLTILSGLLMDTDRNKEALPLIRRAVAIATENRDREHDRHILPLTLNCLSICLARHGVESEVKSLSIEAIRIDESLFGPAHPDVGRDLLNLANILHKESDNQGAACVLERALAIWLSQLDENHLNIADACSNLARVLSHTDEARFAEPLFRNALRIYINSHGTVHPSVASTMRRLALCVRQQVKSYNEPEGTRNADLAELLLWRAMAINTLFYGSEYHGIDDEHSEMYMFLKTTGRYRSPVREGGFGESGQDRWIRIADSDEIYRFARSVPRGVGNFEESLNDGEGNDHALALLAELDLSESPLEVIEKILGPALAVENVLDALHEKAVTESEDSVDAQLFQAQSVEGDTESEAKEPANGSRRLSGN